MSQSASEGTFYSRRTGKKKQRKIEHRVGGVGRVTHGGAQISKPVGRELTVTDDGKTK